jgi:uncharacterized phage-like protein YoqJ
VYKGGDIMSKICCFTGHREIKHIKASVLIERLENTVINLIENVGITDFRAGGARGFDSIAAMCIIRMKAKYPHIKLHMILPCDNQEKYFSNAEKQVYQYVLENADTVRFVNRKYSPSVMFARNRELVNGADVCVAYMYKLSGGTYYTVNYARKNKVDVLNLMKA